MNIDQMKRVSIAPVLRDYTSTDLLLYALSLGYGENPVDPCELPLVYERNQQVLQSAVNILGDPGPWLREPLLGVQPNQTLHTSHSFEIRQKLPTQGQIVASYEVIGVKDRGHDRGAVLSLRKKIISRETGTVFALSTATYLLRADGGSGGFGSVDEVAPVNIVGHDPEFIDIRTSPRIALLFRLNGDRSLIHVDPEISAAAGFHRPILHGLATMGLAERALIGRVCSHQPDRIREMSIRFTSPVFPGEIIRIEYEDQGRSTAFRCSVPARDRMIADGRVMIGSDSG